MPYRMRIARWQTLSPAPRRWPSSFACFRSPQSFFLGNGQLGESCLGRGRGSLSADFQILRDFRCTSGPLSPKTQDSIHFIPAFMLIFDPQLSYPYITSVGNPAIARTGRPLCPMQMSRPTRCHGVSRREGEGERESCRARGIQR